jgi:hypothetical protein
VRRGRWQSPTIGTRAGQTWEISGPARALGPTRVGRASQSQRPAQVPARSKIRLNSATQRGPSGRRRLVPWRSRSRWDARYVRQEARHTGVLAARCPPAADRARSSPIPGQAPDREPGGFSQGLPEGPPSGALDGFRPAQTMISAGDGTPDRNAAVGFRGFMPGAPEEGRGVRRRPRAGGRNGGQLVQAVPGVTRARPPAVAVTGLRRSGRTGNGEGPAGASRPPASLGPSVHTRFRCTAACPRGPRRQAHGALRAPLI